MSIQQPTPGNESYIPTARVIAWFVVLITFVCGMSYFAFAKQSLRLDESQSLWQASHSPMMILNIIAKDVHVPLYHMMLHAWQIFLGNQVYTARILSLLFFIALLPAVYLLANAIYGRKVAVFSTILTAISPFFNWYGNEIRMYTLLTLMTVLNQYFFLKIYRSATNDEAYTAWWGYGITAILGMYSHYFFAFILLTEVIFYFMYRAHFPQGAFKRFLIVAIILIISFAPWLLYVKHINQISNETPQLLAPSSVDLFNTFSEFVFGFQVDTINTVLVSLWPLLILFIFFALRKTARVSSETIYFLMSAFVPIIIVFGVSVTYHPIFVSRYLILCLPSLYIAISWVLETYPRLLKVFFKWALVITILITLGIEAVSAATPVKENYEVVTNYLEQHATVQDVIVASAPFTIYPIEYYYNGSTSLVTLPLWDQYTAGPIPPFSSSTIPTELPQITGDHQNLWLVLSYDQGYEKDIKDYFDNHYQRLYAETYSKDLSLYEYKLKY